MTGRATHLLNAALTPTDPDKRSVDIVRVFPEVFAIASFLAFVPPIVKSVYLAYDPLVSYWLGDSPKAFAVLPMLFIVISYAIQGAKRAPRRGAIALSLIGSSVALGVQANNIAVNALQLSNSFAASDCEFFTKKYELERDWIAARDLRETCSKEIGEDYLIQHCPQYREGRFQHAGWDFLSSMETRYSCGGWCRPSSPLWTSRQTRDSCSTVVSQVLSAKVVRDSIQIVVYNIVVLTLSTISLIMLGPTVHERGFQW